VDPVPAFGVERPEDAMDALERLAQAALDAREEVGHTGNVTLERWNKMGDNLTVVFFLLKPPTP
jgi:hypothetical protein